MDLDSTDSFFIVIENELFSVNSPFQLQEYYKAVQEKFKKAKVREFVYLTISGRAPVQYAKETGKTYRYRVRLSWIEDILKIVTKLPNTNKAQEVKNLETVLLWFDEFRRGLPKIQLEEFKKLLIRGVSYCLHEELQRLCKRENWQVGKNEKSISLKHSSCPTRYIKVEFLDSLSISVQSIKKGKPISEKVFIPLGLKSSQIFNLIDMIARIFYHSHFDDHSIYLANKRKLRTTILPMKREYEPVFKFTERNQYALMVLYSWSNLQ